ncbi:MAG: hypothetical protein EHM79_05255 [Geobacter sp.]|nr:MAG: hypothetical protein EHM79_05255 [Geobacter sp.]
MKKMSVFILASLALSLFVSGCGGSGSSDSTATGATVSILASIADGTSVSAFSNYSSGTFTPATASFTLTSTIFSGALSPSPVTVNSIDVSYVPLEYNSTTHALSPPIGTVYHRAVGGVVTAGGTLDLTDIMIFTSIVGVQGNTAITSLLNSGFDLPYAATVTFNMNEDTTNTPMTCAATIELILTK